MLLPPTIRLAINRWGYKAIHAWLRNNTPLPADHLNLLAKPEIINIASLMNAAANRSPIHTNCLQRSLTLWWLLRRVGVSSDMRIGVIKQEGVVKAHAWLEKDGVIINDNKANLREFTPFDQTIEPTLSDTL